MNVEYYIVVCQEIDMFDGLVIHVNQKVKNLDEVHKIVVENIDKYPNGKWELFKNSIKI